MIMGFLNKLQKKKTHEANTKLAADLLASIKISADKINHAVTVSDFSFYYQEILAGMAKLIELNEVRGISMTPSPRQNLDRIQKNIHITMDAFIHRAALAIQSDGAVWADEMEMLINSIRQDDVVFSLLDNDNFHLLSTYENDIRRVRSAVIEKKDEENKRMLLMLGKETCLDCSDMDAMLVIEAIEKNLHARYEQFVFSFRPDTTSEKVLSLFQERCLSAKIPLAAELRLEDLVEEYRPKFQAAEKFSAIDQMSGSEFERWCAELLKECGYICVSVTGSSGDQGVDITAMKDDIRYAIQCKCYSSKLGNKPVQEVYAGKQMYDCQVGIVMTNSTFTPGAIELAAKTGTLLWDRSKLETMFFSVYGGDPASEKIKNPASEGKNNDGRNWETLLADAVQYTTVVGYVTTSLLQRWLRVGYTSANQLIEEMEQSGIIGPKQNERYPTLISDIQRTEKKEGLPSFFPLKHEGISYAPPENKKRLRHAK